MDQTQLIDTGHDDIIHDIAFNFNGTRFASASSDQTVRVYSQDKQGKWYKDSEQKCHDGPIWRIRWALPLFGTVFATCAQDKSVIIWKEKQTYHEDGKGRLKISWIQKSIILESKEGVADIQFAKQGNVIWLAIGFMDGRLQIHKDADQNQFIKAYDNHVMMYGIRSFAWSTAYAQNMNPFDLEILAIGGNNYQTKYPIRSMIDFKDQQSKIARDISAQSEQQAPVVPTLNLMVLERPSDNVIMQKLNYQFEQHETVYDVQWANLNGRTFNLLATCDDQGFKIWKFKIINQGMEKKVENLTCTTLEQGQPTYRLSWNVTANLIALSQKGQQVKIYLNENGQWICKGIVSECMEKISAD